MAINRLQSYGKEYHLGPRVDMETTKDVIVYL